MRDVVSEIKAKISILDLVSEYVTLKKMGSNYKGLSPFKPEKTPSFIVSPDKGIAYCFSTNRGGDIFKFLMEVENIDFGEALKILAEKAQVTLEDHSPEELAVKKSEKHLQIELLEAATTFFEQQLWTTENGNKVLDYLISRGINQETTKLFRLGYAPDSYDQTANYLFKLGYDRKALLGAGLIMAKDTSLQNIYDRFRGRLIFPVMDSLGRPVGFGARALAQGQEPKYLNSPETPLYQKSSLLYGFQATKGFVKEKKTVLVVEGYMDFLASWQAGVKNVVAVNGTALTMRHLSMLKPYLDKMILAFDMDTAGREAVRRAFELAQDFEWQLEVLSLPGGVKDIADFVRLPQANLDEVISNSQYVMDYFFDQLLQQYEVGKKELSLQTKKKLISDFSKLYQKIKSSIEKDQYSKKLALALGLDLSLLLDEMSAYKLKADHPAKKFAETVQNNKIFSAEEKFLGLLLEFTKCFKEIEIGDQVEYLEDSIKEVYKRVRDQYNFASLAEQDLRKISSDLPSDFPEKALICTLYAREQYGEMPETLVKGEIESLWQLIKVQHKKRRTDVLRKALKEAENKGDVQEVQKILADLSKIYS